MERIKHNSKNVALEDTLVNTPRTKEAEEILNYIGSENPKKRFAPADYKNNKMDYKFGQKWNYGNLDGLDDFHYLTEKVYPDLVNNLYDKMCELNPSLNKIYAKENMQKYELLKGVGSGLHFNDLKYFLENVNCSGKNGSFLNKKLMYLAWSSYDARNPSKRKDVEESINFILSPKTATRIIFNRPYNKK